MQRSVCSNSGSSKCRCLNGKSGCVQESLESQSDCRPLGGERRLIRGEIRNIENTQVVAWKRLSVLSMWVTSSDLLTGKHSSNYWKA